jgi:hypothetical protein
MTTTIKIFRQKVQSTQVYQALGTVQKQIISTRQNIDAIGKSLMLIEKEGVKRWEETSQNSRNNAEIIRELYAKSLTINT